MHIFCRSELNKYVASDRYKLEVTKRTCDFVQISKNLLKHRNLPTVEKRLTKRAFSRSHNFIQWKLCFYCHLVKSLVQLSKANLFSFCLFLFFDCRSFTDKYSCRPVKTILIPSFLLSLDTALFGFVLENQSIYKYIRRICCTYDLNHWYLVNGIFSYWQ